MEQPKNLKTIGVEPSSYFSDVMEFRNTRGRVWASTSLGVMLISPLFAHPNVHFLSILEARRHEYAQIKKTQDLQSRFPGLLPTENVPF